MGITVGNAREVIALRAALNDALTYDEVRAVNWAVVTKEAGPAIARGWTGVELAKWAVGDLSDTTENPAGVIVTALRDLGLIDPPRPPATPTPPPIDQVLADIHGRHQPAANPSEWVAKLRRGPEDAA